MIIGYLNPWGNCKKFGLQFRVAIYLSVYVSIYLYTQGSLEGSTK